ncbi:MAG: DNA repair protein RecO (recombination protein O) [Parcubacteria group bacterium Gr01-1014_33]|nr:MAG: DNA repair protein RecO (recombination protein O) [Parcubacteria group bacterium Gr01-1014_33]
MYFTQGVVLKKIDTGEVDAFFTLYTKDFGKLFLRAQGIKKPDAKLRGHLEPLHFVVIGFISGKNGMRVTFASLRDIFPSVRQEEQKLLIGLSMAEFVDRKCFEGEKDERVWDEIVRGFLLLEKETFTTEEKAQKLEGGMNGELSVRMSPASRDFLRVFEERMQSALGERGEDVRPPHLIKSAVY